MRLAAATVCFAAAAGAAVLVAPHTNLLAQADRLGHAQRVPVEALEWAVSSAVLAPDASAIVFAQSRPRTLSITDLRTGANADFPSPGDVSAFNQLRFQPPLVAWSRDGQNLWASTRSLVGGGFAASALRPVRLKRGGTTTELPSLRSPAGPLDAIQWIGADGLGLAQFGTAGDHYKPEHNDPAPELAMIDAAQGRVLDRLPLSQIAAFRARRAGLSARLALRWASGVVRPDGRLAALFEVNAGPNHRVLVHWVQGQAPVEIAHPAPQDQWTHGALLPSGEAYLLTRELKPVGPELICEDPESNCPSTPPKPRTGPLLELRSITSGRILWTLTATASQPWSGDVLQVAPRGDVALVSYPPAGGHADVALVRLSDGDLLGTLPLPVRDAGFANGGQTVWVRDIRAVLLYRR